MTTRPIRSCVGSEHDNRIATSHPSVDVAHIDLAENWIGIRGERVLSLLDVLRILAPQISTALGPTRLSEPQSCMDCEEKIDLTH